MRNSQEVSDADVNERFREELKSPRVASANRVARTRRWASQRPDRPLRFGDLTAVDEEIVAKIC